MAKDPTKGPNIGDKDENPDDKKGQVLPDVFGGVAQIGSKSVPAENVLDRELSVPIDEISRNVSATLSDIDVDSGPFELGEYDDARICLDRFFEEEAFSHEEALFKIMGLFPELTEEDFDIMKFIENIPREALFSTSSVNGEGSIVKEEMMRLMGKNVLGDWRRDGRAFLKNPVFLMGRNGFCVDTALKCPRFVGDDQDLTNLKVSEEEKKDPVQALRYRILFLKASHEAFRKDDGHRTAYMAAQLSVLIGKNVGHRRSIPLSQDRRIFDVPSGAMFDKGSDRSKDSARGFIKALLSLILPDKATCDAKNCIDYLAQEDFVLVDLMGLAKKMEIYKEFEQVFASIFKLRHLSFVKRFHLSSASSSVDKMTTRRSLMDNLAMMKEYFGKPAKVFSLGHGDGVLENELLSTTGDDAMVSSVTGVDLHMQKDESGQWTKDAIELIEEDPSNDARRKFVNVARGEDNDRGRIDRVFGQFDGQADIGVAADCLHETENPFAYMLRLYENIKPGGFLYVTDPIHCQATDKVTKITLNHFDNTRHVSSMLSLEQYFEIIGYLTMKGAKIYDISITPGTYAGYNDTLWRITFSIRKPDLDSADPAKRDSAPYKLPKENIDWNQEIVAIEDIFMIWPLNCVKEDDREKVLDKIGRNFGKILFGDVKSFVAKGLCGGDIDTAKRFASQRSPYGAVLPNLFANLRNSPMNDQFVDKELERFNHVAGEVLAIVSLLKTECEIDISEKVREVPGWTYVEF